MPSQRTIKDLGIIIIASILGTFAYSYFAYIVTQGSYPRSIWEMWNRWDGIRYLYIAKIGYLTVGEWRDLIAFLPVYPLAVRLVCYSIENSVLAALLVSNTAYALAAISLYKLARLDCSAAVAIRSVVWLSVFPTAYFLHAGYTESLFLFLTLVSFYCARTGRWFISGVAGMFAAGTRLTGCLLLPALLVEYFMQRRFRWAEVRWNIIFLFLIPLGLAFYLYINYLAFHNPLAFLIFQHSSWGKHIELPHHEFVRIMSCATDSPEDSYKVFMSCGAEMTAAVMGFAFSGCAIAWLRPSYSIYMLLTWLVCTSSGYWVSLPRYLLILFPMYIVLARGGRPGAAYSMLLFFSAALYALFTLRFTTGGWAF